MARQCVVCVNGSVKILLCELQSLIEENHVCVYISSDIGPSAKAGGIQSKGKDDVKGFKLAAGESICSQKTNMHHVHVQLVSKWITTAQRNWMNSQPGLWQVN